MARTKKAKPLPAAQISEGVPRARLLEIIRGLLTAEQIQVAAWYAFDGLGHDEIAGRLMGTNEATSHGKAGEPVTRVAVTRRITRINAKLAGAGLPTLTRLRHEFYGRGREGEPGGPPPEKNVTNFTSAEAFGYNLNNVLFGATHDDE